jgi:hypothetical protein
MYSPTIHKPILKWIAQKAYPQRSSERTVKDRISYYFEMSGKGKAVLWCSENVCYFEEKTVEELPVVLMCAG